MRIDAAGDNTAGFLGSDPTALYGTQRDKDYKERNAHVIIRSRWWQHCLRHSESLP
jgi:hypothetical protein